MNHTSLRWAVVEAARGMNARGLNRGRSGNVSARVPEGMLLTPSALPYESLEPAGIVTLGLDGGVVDAGAGPPSTEWHLHAAILAARPDVGAVAAHVAAGRGHGRRDEHLARGRPGSRSRGH